MSVIVPQTGYSTRLLLSLLHDGYSLDEAAALMTNVSLGKRASQSTRELHARYAEWLDRARDQGQPVEFVAYEHTPQVGLNRLGHITAAAA